MFKITGVINNTKCTLTYLDGKITGDEVAVSKTLHEANKNHGQLGLHPTTLDSDYLTLELPARMLIETYVFEKIESNEDDWEPCPENAIF